MDARALRGLADTLAVITERLPPDHSTGVPLAVLRGLFEEESSGIEILGRIRLAAEPARKLTDSLRWSVSPTGERAYWFTRLEQQIESWIQHADRYLRWLDVLAAPPDEFLQPLGDSAIAARRRLLRELPSWGAVARGETGLLSEILQDARNKDGLSANLTTWIADVRAEYEKARGASADLLGRSRHLGEMSDALADGMDMQFRVRRPAASVCHRIPGRRPAEPHRSLRSAGERSASCQFGGDCQG